MRDRAAPTAKLSDSGDHDTQRRSIDGIGTRNRAVHVIRRDRRSLRGHIRRPGPTRKGTDENSYNVRRGHRRRALPVFIGSKFRSSSRCTAMLAGLRTLIQTRHGPKRYVPSTFFDTMPSAPSRQACAKTIGPSSAICSLNRMPVPVRRNSRANAALRSRTTTRSASLRRVGAHASPELAPDIALKLPARLANATSPSAMYRLTRSVPTSSPKR
jgi:hypothetical protein